MSKQRDRPRGSGTKQSPRLHVGGEAHVGHGGVAKAAGGADKGYCYCCRCRPIQVDIEGATCEEAGGGVGEGAVAASAVPTTAAASGAGKGRDPGSATSEATIGPHCSRVLPMILARK